jgi:hypothetical protein
MCQADWITGQGAWNKARMGTDLSHAPRYEEFAPVPPHCMWCDEPNPNHSEEDCADNPNYVPIVRSGKPLNIVSTGEIAPLKTEVARLRAALADTVDIIGNYCTAIMTGEDEQKFADAIAALGKERAGD